MLDGRPCLNFDCVKGWRKRTRSDPWWGTYLGERIAEPEKAPEPEAAASLGRKLHVVQQDQTDESSSHDRWIELGRAGADDAAFLVEGGWYAQHAGTNGMPDGRPVKGITDRAADEAHARRRLDGTFEDARRSFRHGPVPPHRRELRAAAERVIAELVNELDANSEAVKDVFGCSRRLVQTIAKRARQRDDGESFAKVP
jgi:hypothetical protein